MWSKTKSLFLSRILTVTVAGLFAILTFFVPAVSKWYEINSDVVGIIRQSIVIPMTVCLYIAEFFGFCALWSLHRLLENINRDQVFIEQNTRCLRVISWSCVFAGITFAVLSLWNLIFLMPTLMAMMLGLIIRVLKNVFEKAVELKSENDFTV